MINITKSEMINLLRHYRAERESIDALLVELSRDLDEIYSPPVYKLDGVVVQQQFDPGKQVDILLGKCSKARSITRETLLTIKDKTYVLDQLMFCLTKLPGDQRAVITSLVMQDETLEAYSERTNKSRKTVTKNRDRALGNLYAKLTRRKVESSSDDNRDKTTQDYP